MITVNFDGACEPGNPGGVAAWGFVAYKDGEWLHEGSGIYSHAGTSNEAEFSAVLEALRYLADNGLTDLVTISGDSRLVINVLTGYWNLKAKNLLPLFWDIREIESQFMRVIYRWIPRDENELADHISREPYREG